MNLSPSVRQQVVQVLVGMTEPLLPSDKEENDD
jgi:hypothetical protein